MVKIANSPLFESTLRLKMKLSIKPNDAKYKDFISNFKFFLVKKMYSFSNYLRKYKNQLNSSSKKKKPKEIVKEEKKWINTVNMLPMYNSYT